MKVREGQHTLLLHITPPSSLFGDLLERVVWVGVLEHEGERLLAERLRLTRARCGRVHAVAQWQVEIRPDCMRRGRVWADGYEYRRIIENRFLHGVIESNFVSKSGSGREKESIAYLSVADVRIGGTGVCSTVSFIALAFDGWRRSRVDC